ncbi:MAG: hypothetical protein ACP5RW_00830 [bacterium]
MNKTFLTLLKTYFISALPLGVLFLIKKEYLLGYFIGIFIGILDLTLIFTLLKDREPPLDHIKFGVGTLIRVVIIIGVVSIFLFCGIINRLGILGLLIGLVIYPLTLLIGGLRILRCKR